MSPSSRQYLVATDHRKLCLVTYIRGRYTQALDILKDGSRALEVSKAKLGIIGREGIFEEWLLEEKNYLQNLAKEPPQETLQMEYYQRLNHLWQCKWVYLFLFAIS